MLFHVYDDPKPEGYYSVEPHDLYRAILDADWPLVILLPLLLAIVVALLMLAWRIHEIPTHKAHGKKSRQAELVTALTLLGLFQHWVWAVALFFAYLDWESVENTLTRILRRSRLSVEELALEDARERAVYENAVHESAAHESADRSGAHEGGHKA